MPNFPKNHFLQDGQSLPKDQGDSSAALSAFCKRETDFARTTALHELEILESVLSSAVANLPNSQKTVFVGRTEKLAAQKAISKLFLGIEQCKRLLSEQAVSLNRIAERIARHLRQTGDFNEQLTHNACTASELSDLLMHFCGTTVWQICNALEQTADTEHAGEALRLRDTEGLCAELSHLLDMLKQKIRQTV